MMMKGKKMRWLLHTKWELAAPPLSLVHDNAEHNSIAIGSAIFVMISLGSLLAAAVSVVIKNVVILLDYCYWVWATTHAINDLNLDADNDGDYLKDEKDTQVYDTAHHRNYDKGKEDMRPPLLVQQSGKVSGSLSPSGGEMILFDSHCHLQKVSSMQATDRKVEVAKAAGVTSIAICATCPQDWDDVIFTSQHLSNNLMVVLNFGVHPWFLTDNLLEKVRNGMEDEFVWESRLRSLLNAYPLAGVGECGLDKQRRSLVSLSDQVDAMMRQLSIAADLQRPATLHCVRAYGNLIEAIDRFRRETPVVSDNNRNPIILHRFAGDSSFVPRFCTLGCYFSFSINELTKTNDKSISRVKAVPYDRLLLESDSPDAEERSGPVDIVEACRVAAQIRGVNWRDLARLTTANAKRVFSSPPLL